MNKTAIKNFAIWARNKLLAEIKHKAGLLGINENGIKKALPQSVGGVEYYDIGAREPYAISGNEVRQRAELAEAIRRKVSGQWVAADGQETAEDYRAAYEAVVEEVAYTWFNRLIAVRFMEVNDYLPSRIRVLSSESNKMEPDIVTSPFDAQMEFSDAERDAIIRLKNEEKLDEVFRLLFLKQCNELSTVLPALFEKVADYTELLLTISFTNKDGVVYRLVHDIPEEDFNVQEQGQVEIIGWLYQYYNTEPKAKVFARASGAKIKKEEIPAATQLFTSDWIVRYMVENSLGRLWVEGHPNESLQANWRYYLLEAEQEPAVEEQLAAIRKDYAKLRPEDLRCIDPCMGSGHILCYMFDVLVQIYETQGYAPREAAQSILEHNLYGLDIDDRAYQLAYFAVLMKARQYDRRILTRGIQPHVYAIQESNWTGGAYPYEMGDFLSSKEHRETLKYLLDEFKDAKEYGSAIRLADRDYEGLLNAWKYMADATAGNFNLTLWYDAVQEIVPKFIEQAIALSQKYHVVCTNPPYMGSSGMDAKLSAFVKKNYPDSKGDLFAVFIERGNNMVLKNGVNCMVTMQSWMFLSSFEKMRLNILKTKTITNLMHMENMVMGIAFGTAVTCLRNGAITSYRGTYNHIKYSDIVNDVPREFPVTGNRFAQISSSNFAKIPTSPIAYWISSSVCDAYEHSSVGMNMECKSGIMTGSDEYIRLWFEPEIKNIKFDCETASDMGDFKWFPLNSGGEYRKYYGNNSKVVNLHDNGADIIANVKNYRLRDKKYYFRKGITWGRITSASVAFREVARGTLFGDAGPVGFVEENRRYILGFLLSKVALFFLQATNPTINYQIHDIERLPLIIEKKSATKIDGIVSDNIDYARIDWDSIETSWDFQRHPLLSSNEDSATSSVAYRSASLSYHCNEREDESIRTEEYATRLSDIFTKWQGACDTRFNQLKANEEELNRIFIDIYGLQGELEPDVEDKYVSVRKADKVRDIKSLLSYAVGCMFGRYSLDCAGLAYAGGEWDDGKYSTFLPDKDNVIPITDERYFEDDIVGLLCAWVKKVYGAETLEENLDFIAQTLGNKGNSNREIIRNYFLTDFFKDHCSTYSVTGSGKRPIYWLYDSGKQNGFKALCYMHRYNADTTGRVRANYLHRVEKVYESEIGRMDDAIQYSKNNREIAAATKRKEKLQKQLKECREYDERIAHLALARIEIDLDDGVKVNYRKVQTDKKGKFYEILADSKSIMAKEKK